ncbi:hypothetical protein I4U23_016307 [Adineta vaga]|nr:hypothetical protein I4U23_016307 [Adineta vaga]
MLLTQSQQIFENYNRKYQINAIQGIREIIPRPILISSHDNTRGLIKLLSINDTTTSNVETTESQDFETGITSTSTTSTTFRTSSIFTTTTLFQQNISVQLIYPIISSTSIPSNMTSTAVYLVSYPEIENMIRNSLSNESIETNVIIDGANIVRSAIQLKWQKKSVSITPTYFLHVNTTLQIPLSCLGESACI